MAGAVATTRDVHAGRDASEARPRFSRHETPHVSLVVCRGEGGDDAVLDEVDGNRGGGGGGGGGACCCSVDHVSPCTRVRSRCAVRALATPTVTPTPLRQARIPSVPGN